MIQLAPRQASGTNHEGFDTPRVKQDAFLPIIWTLIVLSFCFLPVRLYARWRTFERLFWDDAFTLVAWMLAVSLGVIATLIRDNVYYIMNLQLGNISPDQVVPQIMDYAHEMAYGAIASYMILYSCLWCVKIGFLLFFYRLGVKAMKALLWHWWSVLTFTVICYGACYPSLPYYCTFGGDAAFESDYCSKEQNLSFISMKVNCALDVLTDVLIMTIPFHILWRSRISMRQKFALAGVFSLVVVTMIIAIIRATVTTTGVKKQMDVPWVLLWTSVEANIAIIVACVGSFRMLFVQQRKDPRPDKRRRGDIDKTPNQTQESSRDKRASMWASDKVLVAPWWAKERELDVEQEAWTGPGPDLVFQVHSNGRVTEGETI